MRRRLPGIVAPAPQLLQDKQLYELPLCITLYQKETDNKIRNTRIHIYTTTASTTVLAVVVYAKNLIT